MKTALRVAWLFVAYGAIAWGGEWAMGLLAQERAAEAPALEPVVVSTVVEVEPVVDVRVRPEIVARVQVRHAGHCTYESEREMTLPASADGTVRIRSGAGELHVEGRDGLEEVVVVGLLCASHEEYLDALAVRAEQASGGEILVDTHYPEDRRWRGDGHDVARIDLTVLVPRGMAVEIDDSSGDLVVSGSGDLRIEDSSGSVDVSDIDGDVDIDDGSGGLEVESIAGSLSVDDGSGSVYIADVGGDVRVSDGSGSIDVRGVGGDFVAWSYGSGGIRHSGVEGQVDVPEKKRKRRRR